MTELAIASPSRRGFLKAGGSLTFAILAGGALEVFSKNSSAQAQAFAPGNAWVSITPNDAVVIRVAATEMGQGIMTALPLILAEELDADWAKVRVEQVTHDPKTYGNPNTGGILFTAGSSSVEGYFDIMRRAGAGARKILIHSAARHWGVPVAELASEPGAITHVASGRRLSFGQVAALADIVTDVPEVVVADFKPKSSYRLIGKRQERLDIPDKTRGATLYSIDVRLPGMAYATILRSPVEGESPTVVHDAEAKALAGVVAVVRLEDGVAVVAERWETALNARRRLKVEWTNQSPFRSASSEFDLARNVQAAVDLGQAGVPWESRGDTIESRANAARVIEADFRTDHVYHAQMEPLVAVASVDPDGKGAEVWLGTQSQTVSIGVAAQVLNTTPDRIRFHAMQMGGGFGRRTFFARENLRDALILSRQLRRPVKLMWTREDDMKNGWFRPATAHKLRAALDADGNISAWHHRVACPSILSFAAPQRFESANKRDILVMEGTEISNYRIPNLLAEHVIVERRARVSAWRGIGWGHNCFATECFIDELAQAVPMDAVSFRRRLLAANPRALRVLDAVVTRSNFGKPPPGRAHGLSFAGYKSTLGAGVAEVSVDRATGEIRVHRFWAVVDAGLVIQPKNLEAQTEGGIIFGLSGLLKERVTIVDGEVQQNNFYDYNIMRIDEIPEIDIRVVESDAAPSGGGEIGVPMTGAAVANAVFALTGKRLRHMPFTPDRVKAALSS